MQISENPNGITNHQPIQEGTHIINRNSRSGTQQYFDRGFGKIKNTDFEPLHYADN